ncbi:hypothetical protein EVAR_42938_1 [Eumeta japonica]|uniref:PiggyBac transposable element-derived protein domain-containing protein n=1 Tax=Eumeta variegata TaxID=151549 RepID=A0A4C1YCF2_EUMVA|nr:hypothetical protein EVAR_42938_1 [Eumeta japonica]
MENPLQNSLNSEQEIDSRFEEEEPSCEEVESSENFRPKSTVSKDPHDINGIVSSIDLAKKSPGKSKRISKSQEDGTFSPERDAKPTEANEILAVIGMLLLIGLKKQSRTNTLDLWDPFDGQLSLRACMEINRFLFLLSSVESRLTSNCFGNASPCKTTIYNWFAEFKRGRINLSNEFRDGRPSSDVNNKTSTLSADDLNRQACDLP